MWLSSYDSSFECDRPQTLVEGGVGVASYPGPSKGGGERAWYTLHAHRRGTPEKCGVIGYYCILSIYHPYNCTSCRTCLQMITMVTRRVTMETPAHARAVCTRPFLLLLKGLGMRLGLVLHVAQWYYSSGVPSLYLLVFYHCIHNSQSISAPSP